MTITFDFSQSQAAITHTKQFYESLSLEYVTEADFSGPNTARSVTVTENDQTDTFTIGPFGDHYPSDVSAYRPGAGFIYSVSENPSAPFGFKVPISPAGFPDIRSFVSSSYSSYAALNADIQRYFDAWDAWDNAMNQRVFHSVEFGGLNGASGVFTSTEPMTGLKAMILRGGLMDGNDIIIGSNFADTLHGEGGNDEIRGEAGEDKIQTGSGDDQIFGGSGNDTIWFENVAIGEKKTVYGGADTDTAIFSGYLVDSSVQETEVAELAGAIHISAGFLNPFQQITSVGTASIVQHTAGQSVLKLASGVGGSFLGSVGGDVIDVQTADTRWQIDGGGGNDDIYGGTGDDVLNGGADADNLIGTALGGRRSGTDTLLGGSGADNYFVDNTDVVDELNSDDIIYFLSNNSIDGLLVAFDGEQTIIEAFNDTFLTKETVTITSGISTRYLGAAITNTSFGNSVALFRKSQGSSPDQLERWTFDPVAARVDIEKIWFEMNRTALKDASGELLDRSLEIHLKNGLENLASASLQAIGRSLNIFIKVSDFFEHVVPVLQKGFRGDYADSSDFVIDLAIGLFKVINPFGLATFFELGKGAFGIVAVTIQGSLSQVLDQMEAAFGQYGDGNENATGTDAPDYFYMKGGDDSASGLGGNDSFKGGVGKGNDRYDGGSGTDLVSYASASSALFVDLGGQTAQGTDIDTDTLVSIENIIGGGGNDVILGDSVANWIDGGKGDDSLSGRRGSDSLDGGQGTDRAVLAGLNAAGHAIFSFGGIVYAVDRADNSTDTIQNCEEFADPYQTIGLSQIEAFEALAYGASYDDLAIAIRNDAAGLVLHYTRYGFGERREITFDAKQYTANYADLAAVFGGDTTAAIQHFVNFGVDEHRLAENPFDYVASFDDLITALKDLSYGEIRSIGIQHYQAYGFGEGRRAGVDFDAKEYLANYSDLQNALGSDEDLAAFHFIKFGQQENRLWEDPLEYVASYGDLINAFGSASEVDIRWAALTHYHKYGHLEERQDGIDFDTYQYLANYDDLRSAFADGQGGYDENAALLHFVQHGFAEGRTDSILFV